MAVDQSAIWSGDFGVKYTNRNVADWKQLLPAFRKILDAAPLRSALEVGCNRGHNLVAVGDVLGEGSRIAGIDVNPYALRFASGARIDVAAARASALPFRDNSYDLVFTMGVLIHIPPQDLDAVLREIYRVS